MTFTLTSERIEQALRELDHLTHVDTSDYTEAEYEYRGSLLEALFTEFQQAGLRVAFDRETRAWKVLLPGERQEALAAMNYEE